MGRSKGEEKSKNHLETSVEAEDLRAPKGQVWVPQPGPQVLATMCPANIIFFGGSRGGGKTDCAIGRQITGAMKYGYAWNGLFLRKNFKHFAELRRRIDELIRLGLPAHRIGGDGQTNIIRFDNGGKILLTAIEREEQLEFFQGQSLCVAAGTRILMSDGSPRKIEDVKIGEYIQTLEGPRVIRRKMPPRLDVCVKATTEYGSQIHPIEHPVLASGPDRSSICDWQSYASVLGIGSTGTDMSSQGLRELPALNISAALSPHVVGQGVFSERTPNESCILQEHGSLRPESRERFSETLFCSCLGQELHCEFEQCTLDHLSDYSENVFCYGFPCEYSLKLVQDFPEHYSLYFHHSDAHLRQDQGLCPGIVPSQVCVGESNHDFYYWQEDVQDNIQQCSHLHFSRYWHPYDGTLREATGGNIFGSCLLTPFGISEVIDLTVEEVNHYISYDTGLVNKNTEISIEEACQFPFVAIMIEKLKACLRSPHGVPCKMFLTGNPGGAGHNQVKSRFITPAPGGGVPIPDGDETAIFIPSSVDDNKVLCDNDPKYVNRLKSIKDPKLRAAWLYGDWDVVAGGFFDDVWDAHTHILPRFKVPRHWPRVMGIDWGSATPFAVGWFAVASGEYIPELKKSLPRGALVMYDEWYGCAKDQPNVGIRLTSTQVSQGILEREIRRGESDLQIDRIGDPKMWKNDDGPSVAERMAMEGVHLREGDNQRIPGWDLMRWYMSWHEIKQPGLPPEGDWPKAPMFYVTSDCDAFIRTVPVLERKEKDFEDIDNLQEDHVGDCVRYVCMSRQTAGFTVDELSTHQKTYCEADIEEIEDSNFMEETDDFYLPV